MVTLVSSKIITNYKIHGKQREDNQNVLGNHNLIVVVQWKKDTPVMSEAFFQVYLKEANCTMLCLFLVLDFD